MMPYPPFYWTVSPGPMTIYLPPPTEDSSAERPISKRQKIVWSEVAMAIAKSAHFWTALTAIVLGSLSYHQHHRAGELWDYTSGLHKLSGLPPVPGDSYKP